MITFVDAVVKIGQIKKHAVDLSYTNITTAETHLETWKSTEFYAV